MTCAYLYNHHCITRKVKDFSSCVPYSLCLVCCVSYSSALRVVKTSQVILGARRRRLLRPFSRVALRYMFSRLAGLRGDFSASLGPLQLHLVCGCSTPRTGFVRKRGLDSHRSRCVPRVGSTRRFCSVVSIPSACHSVPFSLEIFFMLIRFYGFG